MTTSDRRRSEEGLATGPAPALDGAVAVGRVVVGELFTAADVARGNDPDGVPDHLRIAVRPARMIDVARDVAADRRISNVQAIELEAPDVPLLQVAPLAL